MYEAAPRTLAPDAFGPTVVAAVASSPVPTWKSAPGVLSTSDGAVISVSATAVTGRVASSNAASREPIRIIIHLHLCGECTVAARMLRTARRRRGGAGRR